MSTFRVPVVHVTVLPHPHADRLEIGMVASYQAIVPKGSSTRRLQPATPFAGSLALSLLSRPAPHGYVLPAQSQLNLSPGLVI